MYFFAYGVNMSHSHLFALCPGAKFIGEGELSDYLLIFDGFSPDYRGSVVNLEQSHDDAVCGGIFDISEGHLKAMDDDHGYPRHSERSLMEIRRPGDQPRLKAWVYHHEPLADGMPSHEYLDLMIKGARECNLPEEYIKDSIEIYRRASDRNKH
ncbi:MAG: gamma-glutamylcyclotransferase family protein [Candidatus Omnitrophota bacterium]